MTEHLISHAYTVPEIERMRSALHGIMFPVTWVSADAGYGAATMFNEREEKIELRLRTYMLNGTRPEELEAIAKERAEQSEQQRRAFETKDGWLPDGGEPGQVLKKGTDPEGRWYWADPQ